MFVEDVTLERIASNVVESTEALAQDEAVFIKMQKMLRLRTYINVIVTTAKLEVCKFDPIDINLGSGTIGNAEYEEVSRIRFRKQLSVSSKPIEALEWEESLRKITKARENTVLVVQANHIIQFLQELEISKDISTVVNGFR
jgi:hypothetical protein